MTPDLFNPLPGGATPLASGPLVSVIPDAGLGGVNALLNPITGQPITTDVFGNPRVNGAGFRDIGAIQVPEPSSVMGTIAGVAFFDMISLRKRSAQFKNRHR